MHSGGAVVPDAICFFYHAGMSPMSDVLKCLTNGDKDKEIEKLIDNTTNYGSPHCGMWFKFISGDGDGALDAEGCQCDCENA